jgi:hypothetical protein
MWKMGLGFLALVLIALAGAVDSPAVAWPVSPDLRAFFAKVAVPAKLKCGIVEGRFTCWSTKKKDKTSSGSSSSKSDSGSTSSSAGVDPSPSSADYQTCHDPEAKSFPGKGCLKGHDSSALPESKKSEYVSTCKAKSGIPLCGPVASRGGQFECWCYF